MLTGELVFPDAPTTALERVAIRLSDPAAAVPILVRLRRLPGASLRLRHPQEGAARPDEPDACLLEGEIPADEATFAVATVHALDRHARFLWGRAALRTAAASGGRSGS